MTRQTNILAEGLGFPEGPRWRHDRLWFSDMNARRVMTVDEAGTLDIVAQIPGSPSGLGWLPDGTLLIVSMADRRLLRLDHDGLRVAADLFDLASYHLNDMVVDRRGRAYIGNFGFDIVIPEPYSPAEIILVDPDGSARVAAADMAFPNGTVITPDGTTLIVAESYARRLTAFTIREEDGSLVDRRLWADVNPALPDGICLDEEGALWVASPDTAEVLRVRCGGGVTHRLTVSTRPFACMLGGTDRRTLFICTAGPSPFGDGRIETARVDIPGAGRP